VTAGHLTGSGAPAPETQAMAVDWSSQSVGELEAFLRSRGVDLGEGTDEAVMVQVAMALAAEDGWGAGGLRGGVQDRCASLRISHAAP
jgi:hypothetical protein